MKANKEFKMKCGFCNTDILTYKDLILYRKKSGYKTVICCPHCRSVLGIYAYQ